MCAGQYGGVWGGGSATQLVRLVAGERQGVGRSAGVVRSAVEERVDRAHVRVPAVDCGGDLASAGLVRARRALTSGGEEGRGSGRRGQGTQGQGDEGLHDEDRLLVRYGVRTEREVRKGVESTECQREAVAGDAEDTQQASSRRCDGVYILTHLQLSIERLL